MTRSGLFDFHELFAATATAAKIAPVMNFDGADDGEDCFQHQAIAPGGSTLGEHIAATPAALNGLIEFDDFIAPPAEGIVFADDSDHLAVCEIV